MFLDRGIEPAKPTQRRLRTRTSPHRNPTERESSCRDAVQTMTTSGSGVCLELGRMKKSQRVNPNISILNLIVRISGNTESGEKGENIKCIKKIKTNN